MKILTAEDNSTFRRIAEVILRKWGYEVTAACNGEEAWQALQTEDPPELFIIDWMMPRMDGGEFCRRARQVQTPTHPYIILLPGRRQKEDVILGLEAGANDYIRKPFDRDELRARTPVGERVIELQLALARQVKELQEAHSQMNALQGLQG